MISYFFVYNLILIASLTINPNPKLISYFNIPSNHLCLCLCLKYNITWLHLLELALYL